MAKTEIIVTANSDMELLTRKTALEVLNALSTDQLKRASKMVKSQKALVYLSSDVKFAILQQFI